MSPSTLGSAYVRYHKAVAVLVEDQAALNFVARGGFVFREFVLEIGNGAFVISGGSGWFGRLPKQEAAVGQFLHQAAFLQFIEHVEERHDGRFSSGAGNGRGLRGRRDRF